MEITASHKHTREKASLFDVSHMCQVQLFGEDRVKFMESLVVADVSGLTNGAATLSVFTNDQGGILDDCIITFFMDHINLVSNAGCADKILAHLAQAEKNFTGDLQVKHRGDRALIAIQGPQAMGALQQHVGIDLEKLPFMHGVLNVPFTSFSGEAAVISRCGFEKSQFVKCFESFCETVIKNQNFEKCAVFELFIFLSFRTCQCATQILLTYYHHL